MNNSHRHCVALIPLRGGSKGIPMKNIKNLNGRPLCDWVIKSALASNIFDQVWVSTDCPMIKEVAIECGALVFDRDPSTASDKAPTNLCIKDFLLNNSIWSDYSSLDIVLIQATSPFTLPHHFSEAYSMYLNYKLSNPKVSGLVTCIRLHQFKWRKQDQDKLASPLNYDIMNRPRRQDWDGELIEDGSFYILDAKEFLKGLGIPPNENCLVYEMPYTRDLDIDEEVDLQVAEVMAKNGWGYDPLVVNRINNNLKVNNVVIVVDIGGTLIRSGISINNKIYNKNESKSNNSDNSLMEKIYTHISTQLTHWYTILSKFELLKDISIVGIGISSGGIVDPRMKVIHESTIIENWDRVEFPFLINDLDVRVENDGNCSLLTEMKLNSFNLDWNKQNIGVITVGTGVGIGLWINNKLLRGTECGKLFENTLCGQTFNKDCMEENLELARDFGKHMVMLVELLNLDAIILNGFFREYPQIVDEINKIYDNGSRDYFLNKCRMLWSTTDNQGLIGASYLF